MGIIEIVKQSVSVAIRSVAKRTDVSVLLPS